MPDSIWNSTLEEFRAQVASVEPVPAGVSTAAVAAGLAAGLLTKVMEISRKKQPSGGRALEELIRSAHEQSAYLKQCADDDIAVYRTYLAVRGRHDDTAAAALRQITEVPLRAARAAIAGLELCNSMAPTTPAVIAPDLAAATTLLEAAVRAILISVDANLAYLTDPDFRTAVETECRQLRRDAGTRAQSILSRLAL